MDSKSSSRTGEELRTLFLTGLPLDVREREVINLCRAFAGFEGVVLSSNGGNKHNKMFKTEARAFAVFTDQAAALAAKEALDGLAFDLVDEPTKLLRVELAKSNSRLNQKRPRAEFEGGDQAGAKRARLPATSKSQEVPSSYSGGGRGGAGNSRSDYYERVRGDGGESAYYSGGSSGPQSSYSRGAGGSRGGRGGMSRDIDAGYGYDALPYPGGGRGGYSAGPDMGYNGRDATDYYDAGYYPPPQAEPHHAGFAYAPRGPAPLPVSNSAHNSIDPQFRDMDRGGRFSGRRGH